MLSMSAGLILDCKSSTACRAHRVRVAGSSGFHGRVLARFGSTGDTRYEVPPRVHPLRGYTPPLARESPTTGSRCCAHAASTAADNRPHCSASHSAANTSRSQEVTAGRRALEVVLPRMNVAARAAGCPSPGSGTPFLTRLFDQL